MSLYRHTRNVVLLLLLGSILIPLVPAHAQPTASFTQQVKVESFGLTKITIKLTYFNNASAFTIEPLNVKFPGYGSFILNSSVPYRVENGDLILEFGSFKVPAHSEKSVSATLYFLPFFRLSKGFYRVNFTLAPEVSNTELEMINCTIQFPNGVRTQLSQLGFMKITPVLWRYFRIGNITEPTIVGIYHSPVNPYLFANLEITNMSRKYLYAESDRVKVIDRLWLKLYDDTHLNSVKVADYIKGRIQVEMGVSSLEYKAVLSDALPLSFPITKGINYVKLEYFIEGKDVGRAVELTEPTQPPIIAYVRHASIYLQDRLIAEASNTASLPKIEVSVPKAAPPVLAYTGGAVLAIIFLGLLLLFSRKKEESSFVIKKKKALAMKYLELYEGLITGLLTKEEFAQQRKELESEKGRISRDISTLREKLVKDKKRKEAERLLKTNRSIEDILRKAKTVYEMGRKKRKKAIEEIKKLMKELEEVK